jgi:translation elongation factor EF-G
MTKGQGIFQMELARYGKVPRSIQEEIIKVRAAEYAEMKK